MFYGSNYPGYQPQYSQPMQQPDYQQQRMAYLQSMQPQQLQQAGLSARFVTCREEAVAATVFPGTPMVFIDRENGAAYYKSIDPNTGAPEFREYFAPRIETPAVPQYVTMDMYNDMRAELESLKAAMQPAPRRQKGADTE